MTTPRPKPSGKSTDKRARPARKDSEPVIPAVSESVRRQSQLLDEGLEETFPASDPVSIVRVD